MGHGARPLARRHAWAYKALLSARTAQQGTWHKGVLANPLGLAPAPTLCLMVVQLRGLQMELDGLGSQSTTMLSDEALCCIGWHKRYIQVSSIVILHI